MRTSFATKGLASAAPNWKPHERRDEIQKLQVEKDLNCIHFRRISDHDNDTFMFHPSLSVRSFKLLTLNSIFWCPGRELNPHSRCRKTDFKSKPFILSQLWAGCRSCPELCRHWTCGVPLLRSVLMISDDFGGVRTLPAHNLSRQCPRICQARARAKLV